MLVASLLSADVNFTCHTCQSGVILPALKLFYDAMSECVNFNRLMIKLENPEHFLRLLPLMICVLVGIAYSVTLFTLSPAPATIQMCYSPSP